jgi:archaellum component FlaC
MISDELERRGGGGHDGGMDDVIRRVGALEGDMKEVKADIKGLTKEVFGLRSEIAEIKGKLSNMPTTFQMASWFVGVAIGLTGLVFAIARIMGTH